MLIRVSRLVLSRWRLAVSVALGVVLLRSATAHIANPYFFFGSVLSYGLISPAAAELVAGWLPFLELVLGACLCARVAPSGAPVVSAVLFGIFTAAQSLMLVNDRSVSCGCFGASASRPVGPISIAIAGGCLVASLALCMRFGRRPANPSSEGDRRRAAFTLVELLVSIAIVGVLLGLAAGAVQKVRSAAAKTDCANKLHQVGLGLHSYHGVGGRLPPGVSVQAGADPLLRMTWLTRLLPHIEQGARWQQTLTAYGESKRFEQAPHWPVLGSRVDLFVCPADTIAQTPWFYRPFSVGFTSYLGSEGIDLNAMNGVLYMDSAVRLSEITDGTSNTIAAGERPPGEDHKFGWWYAGWGQIRGPLAGAISTGSLDSVLGVREVWVDRLYEGWACPAGPDHFRPGRASVRCDASHFWSYHSGGGNFLFADGSVRFLNYSADSVLPALATRAGGEVVEIP